MRKKHFTIPVFIPLAGCPNQCVFCDQGRITGSASIPAPGDVQGIIESHLSTMPAGARVELGFFGGSFTGLPIKTQLDYLTAARPFLQSGRIQGVRLSTRPDYITPHILQPLKDMGVTTIELGAQSFDPGVLRLSGRGHTAQDIIRAAALIQNAGIRLGLQMMTGLPGDTLDKTIATAHAIVDCGAADARIYPAVVVDHTELSRLYRAGQYRPLSLSEAVEWTAAAYEILESAGIHIIRVGLHPSDGLAQNVLAGPYHPSLREMVLTRLWQQTLTNLPSAPGRVLHLAVAPREANYAAGYKGTNRAFLKTRFRDIRISEDNSLTGRDFHADLD